MNISKPMLSPDIFIHFLSEPHFYFSGCGGILNRPYGFFHSPGYPGPYAMNIDCVWSIIVEWSTSIEITVSVVELEQSPGCNIDVLEVRQFVEWSKSNEITVSVVEKEQSSGCNIDVLEVR